MRHPELENSVSDKGSGSFPGLRFLKLSHKEGKGSPCYGFIAQFIEAARGLRSTFPLFTASVVLRDYAWR